MQVVELPNTERVFALKNVRLFYKKSGTLRFASHLDMNRVMTRLLRLSKVPIWYTEGFNRHPYITFALPLSLGFTSEWEVMDFRLDNDDFSLLKAQEMISSVCPKGIEVIALKEPVFKSGKIAKADFCVTFSTDTNITEESVQSFLSQPEIKFMKKTKKGGETEIDLAKKIFSYSVEKSEDSICLNLRLPAGGQDNINPKMLIDAYYNATPDVSGGYAVCRKALLLEDGTLFE